MKVHKLTDPSINWNGRLGQRNPVRQHVNLQFSDSNKKIQFQQPRN